jgi:hypothetical protein
MSDSMCRKWILTINNPLDHGFPHECIKETMARLASVTYWCMADEIGLEEETPHTHLYLYSPSPIRFSTMKKVFPPARLEQARGSTAQCRDYIQKSGAWAEDEKSKTSIPGTFFEWGELPHEPGQGARSDLAAIVELIKDEATNEEIRELYPAQFLLHKDKIERVRQEFKEEQYRDTFRILECTYIWGKTESGKTRYVMEKHGYANVCHVTNYKHPFDKYRAEDVIAFDEWNSQLPIQDMNNYLDGYPLTLPARYADRVACYTKVFIISNMDLTNHYRDIQRTASDVWDAFTRRIQKVIRFMPDGSRREYDTQDYLRGFTDTDEPTPFEGGERYVSQSTATDAATGRRTTPQALPGVPSHCLRFGQAGDTSDTDLPKPYRASRP